MDSYDVIVVGAGNAACAAAVSARQLGAKRVLVQEKAQEDLRGGNTHYSGGLLRVAFEGDEDLLQLIPDVEKQAPGFLKGEASCSQIRRNITSGNKRLKAGVEVSEGASTNTYLKGGIISAMRSAPDGSSATRYHVVPPSASYGRLMPAGCRLFATFLAAAFNVLPE